MQNSHTLAIQSRELPPLERTRWDEYCFILSGAARMDLTVNSTDRTTQIHEAKEAILANKDRVRVPLFPVYSAVRHLLPIWPRFKRTQITGYQTTIARLRGTPQNPVDWTQPDTWIPERLEGTDLEFARAVWKQSMGAVNPRHVYGHWLLANRYGLLCQDGGSVLRLTAAGRDFLEQPGGEIEAAIDEAEGLIKLLSIVADKGPARPAALVKEWTEFLSRRSHYGKDSTIKDSLRRRLTNLLERVLLERSGSLYSVTTDGLSYLERTAGGRRLGGTTHHQIQVLTQEHEITVREGLREKLFDMDAIAFEHLIKRLLEEMNYRNVEVTAPTGDGGVDVLGDIELGITSIREVVQAKRHRNTIQRRVLDALRGSLYRFDAVRGTIITTSQFSKGTQDAAFATGAAPITLIDGNKLIELLIEHGIGVRKRSIELLEIDEDAFANEEMDD